MEVLYMKHKEKDIFSVVANMTLVLIGISVLMLVYAKYIESEFIYVNIVSVVLLICNYVYQRNQIKPR